MRPPFALVPDHISHDTRQCLRELYEQSDDIIGILYGVMFKGRSFIVNTAGEAYRNPTFSRGVLATLDDELSQMIWRSIQ